MVSGAGQGGGIVLTVKLDQASFAKLFTPLAGGATGGAGGAGGAGGQGGGGQAPGGGGGGTGGGGGGGLLGSLMSGYTGLVTSIVTALGLKELLSKMVANSSIANTYLGAMGKMFGAAMDILLLPFIPLFNLLIVGMGYLVRWLITSGYLQKMSDLIDNFVTNQLPELINWVRGLPEKFSAGVVPAIWNIGRDVANALFNLLPSWITGKNSNPPPVGDVDNAKVATTLFGPKGGAAVTTAGNWWNQHVPSPIRDTATLLNQLPGAVAPPGNWVDASRNDWIHALGNDTHGLGFGRDPFGLVSDLGRAVGASPNAAQNNNTSSRSTVNNVTQNVTVNAHTDADPHSIGNIVSDSLKGLGYTLGLGALGG